MSKKIIIAAIGIAVLGAASAVIGYFASRPAVADETPYVYPDPKVGKYYLENGTEDEYIQVYDDGTIQVFGLEYFEMNSQRNAELLASVSDEEYEEYKKEIMKYDAFWKAKHYYIVDRDVGVISFSDTRPEPDTPSQYGQCLLFDGGDTIVYDESIDYVYHYKADTQNVAESLSTAENTAEA